MATTTALLAYSRNGYHFDNDPEFWVAIVVGPIAIIASVVFALAAIRACLDYMERKRTLGVLQTLAQQGQLDADRMERMLGEMRRTKWARRGTFEGAALARAGSETPAGGRSAAANALIATRDRAFRLGFLLLAASLGFFGAAGLGGEEELLVPACILGGIGLGLSGMGVARREALERIGRDVDRSAIKA